MKKNKFALILFLLYVIGFILYFIKDFKDIGAIILIGAVILHIAYTFSPHQRAAVSMLNARRMVEMGNIEKAYQYVTQYLKLSKDKTLVGYLLSTSKKSYPFYQKLAEILENDLKKNESMLLRYVIASIYYSINNLEKTIEILKKIPKDKMDTETVRLLGTALLESKKPDDAIDIFKLKEKKTGVPSPDKLSILLGLGLSYAEKNDMEKAEKYYRKVQKFNPAFPELSTLKKKIFKNEQD